MSPFTESRCPLCRTKYGHLPHVISKLHSFLKAVFPEEYAQREVENAEEEEKEEIASPDLSDALPAKSTSGTIAKEDFLCDICDYLLYKPTVLTCGHVICGVSCLEKGKIPGGKNKSGKTSPDTTTSAVLRYECACGVCGQPLAQRPRPCRQLEDLIQSVFREEYSAREALERQQEKSERTAAATEGEPPASSEGTPGAAAEALEVSDLETQANNQPTANLAAATAPTDHPPPPPLPFSSSGQSALTGPHAEIYKWLQGKDYTHFGIGCDCCGQFPITGRRYRCTDCPETVGFDLCGDCYDRGVSSDPNSRAVLGRFNQRHTPEHKMELCRPRLTSLHMLRAANPELSFDQLMYLLQVSGEREEEDDQVDQGHQGGEGGQGEGGENGGEGVGRENAGARQQEGEDSEEEVEVEVENDIPIPHGRGPRPIQDPSAQWPSPSSFNNTIAQPPPPPATGED
ncbi:hypothetical protein Ndes2526B_g07038 [Nannochloris sp. 'desiccata']